MIPLLRTLASLASYPLFERLLGRSITPKLKELRSMEALPFSQRQALQRERLIRMLRHAGKHVPYYRDLFAELKFDPDDLAGDPDILERLPYLTKDIVREQGERMLDERLDRQSLHLRKTGASSGPSMEVLLDDDGLDWTAASNLLALEWAGKKRHESEVHLSALFYGQESQPTPFRERCKLLAMNRTNIHTRSLDKDSLGILWKSLAKARPRLVQGHPSTMSILARHLKDRGIDASGAFRLIESTGEALNDTQRALMEEVFGCLVFNRYGCAEFGMIAQETAQSRAHRTLRILDSMVLVEERPLASPAKGKLAELAVTGLTSRAMPLIRYRMGDLGRVKLHEDGAYISDLHGRIHDMVPVNGSLLPTHFLQDILDHRVGGVDDFQIALRREAIPELRLVVPDTSRHTEIRTTLDSFFRQSLAIRFIETDELLFSGWRGKFRYVINDSQDSSTPATQTEPS